MPNEQDYEGVEICGVTAQETGPLAKWPGDAPSIPWHIDTSGYKGSFTADKLREIFAVAWAAWAKHVEITPVPSPTAEAAFVQSHFARIDGSSSVLAWSMLADNTNRPKTQRYDNSESWSADSGPNPPGIDLIRVAIHEIGHVLGLDHDRGDANAIMRPSYSRSLPEPTERDIQRLIGLGYKRRTTPTPAPTPPAPTPVPGDPLPVTLGPVVIDPEKRTVTVGNGWAVGRTPT